MGIWNIRKPRTQALGLGWYQHFSKYGLQTSKFSVTWELGRKANSWASPQTYKIRNAEDWASNLYFDKSPVDSDIYSSLKTTGSIHSLTHWFLWHLFDARPTRLDTWNMLVNKTDMLPAQILGAANKHNHFRGWNKKQCWNYASGRFDLKYFHSWVSCCLLKFFVCFVFVLRNAVMFTKLLLTQKW